MFNKCWYGEMFPKVKEELNEELEMDLKIQKRKKAKIAAKLLNKLKRKQEAEEAETGKQEGDDASSGTIKKMMAKIGEQQKSSEAATVATLNKLMVKVEELDAAMRGQKSPPNKGAIPSFRSSTSARD